MSSIVSLFFSSIVFCSIIYVQVHCNCFPVIPPLYTQAPLPLTRCIRNLGQNFQLIPAALYSNGIQQFITPLPFSQSQQQWIDNKRATRQQQSAVVQQVTINQNTAPGGNHPSFGFGGFKHPCSLPQPHSHRGSGGRPSFGVFRERSSGSNSELMPPAKCPVNYIFSCQPTVTKAI